MSIRIASGPSTFIFFGGRPHPPSLPDSQQPDRWRRERVRPQLGRAERGQRGGGGERVFAEGGRTQPCSWGKGGGGGQCIRIFFWTPSFDTSLTGGSASRFVEGLQLLPRGVLEEVGGGEAPHSRHVSSSILLEPGTPRCEPHSDCVRNTFPMAQDWRYRTQSTGGGNPPKNEPMRYDRL